MAMFLDTHHRDQIEQLLARYQLKKYRLGLQSSNRWLYGCRIAAFVFFLVWIEIYQLCFYGYYRFPDWYSFHYIFPGVGILLALGEYIARTLIPTLRSEAEFQREVRRAVKSVPSGPADDHLLFYRLLEAFLEGSREEASEALAECNQYTTLPAWIHWEKLEYLLIHWHVPHTITGSSS